MNGQDINNNLAHWFNNILESNSCLKKEMNENIDVNDVTNDVRLVSQQKHFEKRLIQIFVYNLF